jgi:YARHG domain
MKSILFIFIISSFVLLSCNNAKKENNEIAISAIVKTDSTQNPLTAALEILGSYVGSFGTNKITLLITKATTDSIVGRSIVGGNDRPFTGTILKKEGKYIINAKEPDDDKEDGIFDFEIDTKNPNIVGGTWKPNKVTTTVQQKDFKLERKIYTYLKEVGHYPQASNSLLAVKDVENLMKEDLEFMRNEIFARHGYCFQKKALRQQFENQEWYVPNTIDIKNRLTDIEKKNIALIKKYEKYAEEYGDDFGR